MNKSIESHEPPSEPVRLVNGLSNAPTRWQVASICIFLGLFSQHYMTIAHVSNFMLKLIFIFVESALVLLLLFLWYKVSTINPSDPIQQQQLASIQKIAVNQQQISATAHISPSQAYNYNLSKIHSQSSCPVCRTHRLSMSTHCKKCNKCILLLDHHCKWVNNCIGAANYYQFIMLLLHIVVLLMYNSSVNIWCIVHQLQLQLLLNNGGVVRIVTIISTVAGLILWVIVAVLIGFHGMLIKIGKTNLKVIKQARNRITQIPQDSTITITCSTPKQAEPTIQTSIGNNNSNINEKLKLKPDLRTKNIEPIKNSNGYQPGERKVMVEMRNIKLDKIIVKNNKTKTMAKIGLTT